MMPMLCSPVDATADRFAFLPPSFAAYLHNYIRQLIILWQRDQEIQIP